MGARRGCGQTPGTPGRDRPWLRPAPTPSHPLGCLCFLGRRIPDDVACIRAAARALWAEQGASGPHPSHQHRHSPKRANKIRHPKRLAICFCNFKQFIPPRKDLFFFCINSLLTRVPKSDFIPVGFIVYERRVILLTSCYYRIPRLAWKNLPPFLALSLTLEDSFNIVIEA